MHGSFVAVGTAWAIRISVRSSGRLQGGSIDRLLEQAGAISRTHAATRASRRVT
jgi:hypothetical protein